MLDLRYSSILKMAIPLMGSSFIQSIVMITDSSYLSRYSTIDYDAAGNAGLIYITMFVILMGLSDSAQIIMARRIGEKKENLLPHIFGTGLFSNLILASLLFALLQISLPQLINWYTDNKAIAACQIDFIEARSYGLFFAVISLAISAYLMAIGKTILVLFSAFLTASSNIFLDYGLIFGHYGMPELGATGAAIASTMADGIGMLFLISTILFNKEAKSHQLIKKMRISWSSMQNLFKVGTPMMMQGALAVSVWTLFFIWIEQMGTFELTVSQNIRTVYFLAFVPIWGFAGTTKTYVSQYIGNKDFGSIRIIQRKIQLMSVVFIFILMHGAIFYPEWIITLINPNPLYLQPSADILRFLSGSIFIYGLTNVYFHTITGSGNTFFTFYVEVIAVGLYLLSAYLFIIVFKWDIYWIWSVEYIYFIAMAVCSLTYLKFFNWQKKTI